MYEKDQMIKLKIKEPGHTVAIPGLKVFRSPVDVDISKLDIRVVSMYLKSSGIEKYEIIAEMDGNKETYTQKDFDLPKKKKVKPQKDDARFGRLEKMMEILIARDLGKSDTDSEQINNKLDKLEKLFNSDRGASRVVNKPKGGRIEPEIEELDSFIPEVDISDMKLSSENIKKVKQEDDGQEDAADILSGLMRRG